MMKNIIEIKNVTFQYKGAKKQSLKDVSLSVHEGEVILLCGASGSGKTSVIRLINGLIPHYYSGELSGSVQVDGYDIADIELQELAGVVGTVFQNPRSQFFSTDTDGEIVFGPENIGLDSQKIKRRKEKVIADMQIQDLLNRSLFELSGGEKQKIACASVAALFPDIILLDEPSSNLDWDAIKDLRKIVEQWRNQGKTIIISEHRLWYLKGFLDRIIYMKEGKVTHEWNGEEFSRLSEKELENLQLRPTAVAESLTSIFDGDFPEAHTDPADFTDPVVLQDFFFSYHRKPYFFVKKKFAEKDGDLLDLCIPKLELPKGKVTCVIGRNGAGKSTLLRCLCGLEKDCGGTIEVDGRTYKGRSRLRLSYLVMQDVNHQLFTDSVEEECLLSMKEKDTERCHEILDQLGILEYKDVHPMALSGGQKQRVAIASAIAAGAKILLLDEPTSGLDFTRMKTVGELLRKLADSGQTILVSTHDPELISLCGDYELYIRQGRVKYFGKT